MISFFTEGTGLFVTLNFVQYIIQPKYCIPVQYHVVVFGIIECDKGWYGADCKQSCSEECMNEECHHIYGNCTQRCKSDTNCRMGKGTCSRLVLILYTEVVEKPFILT